MPRHQALDLEVDGAPADVAARLRASTRFRLQPFQGSPFGGGARPLGGYVSDGGFRVALDPRDWTTRSQAVAVGTLTPAGPGRTRVQADVGLPTGVTWAYRFAWVVGALLGVGVGGGAAASGLPWLTAVGIAGLFLAVGVVLGTLALGWHVAGADAQVEPLVAQLTASLQGSRAAEARQRAAPRVPEG